MQIAILGTAPSSVRLAPFGDPSWQIWACSPGTFPILPRCDAFFELHRQEPPVIGKADKQVPWFSPEYWAWLGQQRLVWMVEHHKDIPGSRRLPVERLLDKYGHFFFTSSIAWMLAMALEAIGEARAKGDNGPHAIGMWGVDMAACPSPDTRILRDDLTWVRADDLRLGDKIIAFDEEPIPNGDSTPKRRWRVAEVTRNARITKPCYRVTLEDGRDLVCSDEHKWLTHAEHHCQWRMTKDLVTPHHRADRPSRIVKLCDVWSEDRSWDAGYLAAAFDGEGHITQKLRDGDHGLLRVGFAQRDNEMSDEVNAACERLGFKLGLNSTDQGVNGDVGKYSIAGGRVKTMEFLGRIRPRRLLAKFDPENLGIMQKAGTVAVVAIEDIGEQPVIGLTTSTGTFIAEGLATHNTEEYGYQRSGCQFFVQLAADLDIQIILPPESDLMTPPPLYGIFESSHKAIKLTARMRELQQNKANLEGSLAQVKSNLDYVNGAISDLQYVMNNWMSDGNYKGVEFKRIFRPEEWNKPTSSKEAPEDAGNTRGTESTDTQKFAEPE